MKKIKWSCLTFLLIFCSSCLEKIDFERPDTIKDGIVIQAKLIKGSPSIIEVSTTTLFDFFSIPKNLPAEAVILIDEDNNQIELDKNQPGFYSLEIPEDHPDFKIEYGKRYKLRIELLSRVYESDWEIIQPTPEPDQLEVKIVEIDVLNNIGKIVKREALEFYISTDLKASNNSDNALLLWELVGVSKITDGPIPIACNVSIDEVSKSCYVEFPPIENFKTFNGPAFSRDRIEDFPILRLSFTSLLSEGYYLEVHQQATTQAAYDYWSSVSLAVDREGEVFQEPAGDINSNIINTEDSDKRVFGFFYATEQKTIRVYVDPELANNPPKFCTASLSDVCCNCENFENSTSVKPEWWTE